MIGVRCARAALLVILSSLLACAGWDAASAKRAPLGCQRSTFRVVLDVGHTLEVPGAFSAHGIPEYAFNLQLATETKRALLDAGFKKTVLLITEKAPPEGLVERASRANNLSADLFIAIHHDSVPDYLLESWQVEGQEYHFNDSFPGYAIFVSNDNPHRGASLQFGHLLGEQLQGRGLQYTPHYTLPLMRHRRRELLDAAAGVYRYDQLIVLRETHMPAVLLEAGSIINRQEEPQLASEQRRALTAAAVTAAVEQFCAARSRQRSIHHSVRISLGKNH